jgi:hypothetical protein
MNSRATALIIVVIRGRRFAAAAVTEAFALARIGEGFEDRGNRGLKGCQNTRLGRWLRRHWGGEA